MKTLSLLIPFLPPIATNPILPPAAMAKCSAPAYNVCAQFVYANGTVSQDIFIDSEGCTEVINPSIISGIKVYDCWCGLWNAQSTAGCNNGNDETVDQINQCTGLVDREKKGWKWDPTHVSCWRP